MDERTVYRSGLQAAVLIAGLVLSAGIALAESTGEKFTPSLLPPSAEVDQSVLNRRLQTARKDLEGYRVFAEHFHKSGDLKSLAQLQDPVDEFLKKHVDNLLTQGAEHATLEATRLTAEIMFIKTRLCLSMNRTEAAKNTVADMKKRFGPYQKISVELPGMRTTLDEGIRLLDDELAKSGSLQKK